MRRLFVIAIAISAVSARAVGADQNGGAGHDPTAGATAPPLTTEAMRLYDEGLRHFRAGAYDEAIRSLKAAYERAPLSALLYDLGQAYRLKGDCAQALLAYQHFLATAPVGHQRALAEARVADMQRCASASPEPADSAADSPANTGNTAVAPTTSPSPPASLAASPPAGAPPGPLALTALPSPSPAPTGATQSHLPAMIAGAVAVGLAGTSGYFAWSASNASDEVSAVFVPGGTWSEEARKADGTGRWADGMAIATGAGALISAGVAAWLLWR